MKKVLIIDSHPLFREFLKQKLYDDQIEVVLSQVGRDAYTRTISILPNLIILDMSEDRLDEMEFLEKKAADLNTSRIPLRIRTVTSVKSCPCFMILRSISGVTSNILRT